jgi:hypothetical protein
MAHAPTHDDLSVGMAVGPVNADWGDAGAPGAFAMPDAADAGSRGPADVAGLYPLVFAENLLFTQRMVPLRTEVNAVVPRDLDEVEYLRFLHVTCHGIAAFHNLFSMDTIDAITIYQGLGPFFPADAIATIDETLVNVRRAAVAILGNVGGMLDKVAPEAPAKWAAANAAAAPAAGGAPAAPQGPLHGFQYDGNAIAALPLPGPLRATNISPEWAYRSLAWLASVSKFKARNLGLCLLTTLCVAAAKRGSITHSKLSAIMRDINNGTGLQVELDATIVNLVYQKATKYVTGQNAGSIFRAWSQGLDIDTALRLKLTIDQAANAGLTAICLIRRALTEHPDFYWHRVASVFQAEFIKVGEALRLIHNNPYYGFNKDLGPVKSTNYPSITWIAKTLLIAVGGNDTLKNYAGFTRGIKHQDRVQRWIEVYTRHLDDAVDQNPDDASADRAAEVMALARESTAL